MSDQTVIDFIGERTKRTEPTDPSIQVSVLMSAIKTALTFGLDTEVGQILVKSAYNCVLNEEEEIELNEPDDDSPWREAFARDGELQDTYEM